MANTAPKPELPTRRLRVTSCEPFHEFTTKDGRKGTLYKVRAEDEHGRRVSARLRSFGRLPVDGQVREYQIRKDDHPQYGTSFVLAVAGGLTGRVETLERTVGALGQRIRHLEQGARSRGQTAA